MCSWQLQYKSYWLFVKSAFSTGQRWKVKSSKDCTLNPIFCVIGPTYTLMIPISSYDDSYILVWWFLHSCRKHTGIAYADLIKPKTRHSLPNRIGFKREKTGLRRKMLEKTWDLPETTRLMAKLFSFGFTANWRIRLKSPFFEPNARRDLEKHDKYI